MASQTVLEISTLDYKDDLEQPVPLFISMNVFTHSAEIFSCRFALAGGSVGDVDSSACRHKTTNDVASGRNCVQWARTKWKWTTDDGSAQRKYYYEFGDIWTDSKHDNIIIATKDFYLCANASPLCPRTHTIPQAMAHAFVLRWLLEMFTVFKRSHFTSLWHRNSSLRFFHTMWRPMCSLSAAFLASSIWKSICFYRLFVRWVCAGANKSANNCRK